MADKKISQLTYDSVPDYTDVTIIVDSADTTDKKVLLSSLPVSDPQQLALDAKVRNIGDSITGAITITNLSANPNLTIQNTDSSGISGVFLEDDTGVFTATVGLVNSTNTSYSEAAPGDLLIKVDGGIYNICDDTRGFKIQNEAIANPLSVSGGVLSAPEIDASRLTIGSVTVKSTPVAGDKLLMYDVAGAATKNTLLSSLPLSNNILTRLTNTSCSIYSDFTPVSVTGTAEQIIRTVTISGGTLSANDILFVKTCINSKSAAVNGGVLNLKINTSNTLTGATLIGTQTITSTNLFVNMRRKYLLSSGILYGAPFGTSAVSDLSSLPVAIGATAFNPSNTYYLFLSVSGMTSDTFTNHAFQVDKE